MAIFAVPKREDSLAQQVEHNTFNVGVLGSSPRRITRKASGNRSLFCLYILRKICRLFTQGVPGVDARCPEGQMLFQRYCLSRFNFAADYFFCQRVFYVALDCTFERAGSILRIKACICNKFFHFLAQF